MPKHQTPNKRKRKLSAFTLVELIVVITILAILGTVGFLALGGYSSNARDSQRSTDIANLSKSLDVSVVTAGSYPSPDNSFAVTYSGGTVWNQGTFGTGALSKLGGNGINKRPLDPLKSTEYAYSVLAFGKAYSLKTDYEWSVALSDMLVPTAYAASGNPTVAYVRGNFGGLSARTETGGIVYVIALPSILTNTGSVGTVLEIKNNALSGTLLFNGKNLTGASSFNPTTVVFSGASLPKDNTGGQITNMMVALKNAYASSDVASSVPAVTTLVNTATGSLATLGSSVIVAQLGGTVKSDSSGANCAGGTQSGYTITALANGETQSFTKAITNGSGSLSVTCNNGTLAYGTEVATNCTSGLPIGAACTCPTGGTCATNGVSWLTAGTYTFTLSSPLTVGAVAVGGGGGGGYNWATPGGAGGGLSWGNGISLVAGTTYTVVVGAPGQGNTSSQTVGQNSTFTAGTQVITAYGGGQGGPGSNATAVGYGGWFSASNISGTTGGGAGGDSTGTYHAGGAGGYTGKGGSASNQAGSGGGGGSPAAYSSTYGMSAGGGTGIFGIGTNGVGGSSTSGAPAYNYGWGGGSKANGTGTDGYAGECSSLWSGRGGNNLIQGGFPGGGGGGGGTSYGWGPGGGGAVRIIWGAGRSFPSNAN